jgi:hypothetical protein
MNTFLFVLLCMAAGIGLMYLVRHIIRWINPPSDTETKLPAHSKKK